MHTDKNSGSADPGPVVDPGEESEDATLRWLLAMDTAEAPDALFAVEEAEYVDAGLTEYEAEVASRPMVRGRADADDFASYIEEEIIISADSASGDIYSAEPAVHESIAVDDTDTMAIDYSREPRRETGTGASDLAEGADVLGLAAEDDIGEQVMVLRRAQPEVQVQAGTDELPAPTPVNGGDDATDVRSATEQAAPVASPVPAEVPTLRLVTVKPGPIAAGKAATEAGERDLLEQGDSGLDGVAAASSWLEPVAAQEVDQVDCPREADALPQMDTAIEELLVAFEDGALSPEEAAELSIDYHEDFSALAGFAGEAVARITPLVPQLMAQVAAQVERRLQELGLAPATVQAEVVFAGDPDTLLAWQADGFEPVHAICPVTPAALEELGEADSGEIFLKLTHTPSGEQWNTLLQPDFTPVGTGVADEPAVESRQHPGELPDAQTPPAVTPDEDARDFLGLELGGEFGSSDWLPDADDQFAGNGWLPGSDDIDAIFADFDGSDADILSATAGSQAEVVDEPPVVETVPAGGAEPEPADRVRLDAKELASGDPVQVDAEESVSAEPVQLQADELASADPVQAGIDDLLTMDAARSDAGEPAGPGPNQPAADEQPLYIPKGIAFSHASQSSAEIFSDFLDAFIEEGASELEKLEDAIGAWEHDIACESAYTAVTRTLHTIKGIAKGVGLHYYGTLIHNFETLLECLQKPAGETSGYFRIVNIWLDAAVRGMDRVQDQRADIDSEFPQQPGMVAPVAGAAGPGEDLAAVAPAPVVEAAVVQPRDPGQQRLSRQLADEGARRLGAQQSVRITSDKLDHLLNLSNQAQQLGVRTAQSTARARRASAEMHSRLSSVRSQIAGIADRAQLSVTSGGQEHGALLDALEMDQYSELQEAANILREGVEDLADLVDFTSRQNVQVEALLNQQATVISSIGSAIRSARVVPVSRLVPGLRRLVRTVSNDLGKDVSLQALNELGTLDRDDFARCQTMLDHMVRNALDHGIESRQQRLDAGKTPAGRITIDISRMGADAVIILADDGRGIDPAGMRDSARRKGLEVDVDALTDAEALRLIFHRGFSTASSVSQISGRGVGMDIVLSELQQMGGDIQIESTVGQGTAFHIRIPSSVTVNGALLVRAADQSYAIPLGGLIAVEHVPVADFFAAAAAGDKLAVGGMACEPAYLATLCQGAVLPDESAWHSTVPVIVAGSAARFMAIAIDDVQEALELVIRSLGVQFATVPGVAGAATTADGEAIVALDLNLLVASAAARDQPSVQVAAAKDKPLLAMVVDDSRTQRMVATSQLETVGVDTVTAENGAVAVDLLNTADELPDIILLDIEMPVKDGIQTLREIRKSPRYGHIPVIMVTSRTGVKHRSLAKEAGCSGYMGKPFNFQLLLGQINELTGRRLQLA